VAKTFLTLIPKLYASDGLKKHVNTVVTDLGLSKDDSVNSELGTWFWVKKKNFWKKQSKTTDFDLCFVFVFFSIGKSWDSEGELDSPRGNQTLQLLCQKSGQLSGQLRVGSHQGRHRRHRHREAGPQAPGESRRPHPLPQGDEPFSKKDGLLEGPLLGSPHSAGWQDWQGVAAMRGFAPPECRWTPPIGGCGADFRRGGSPCHCHCPNPTQGELWSFCVLDVMKIWNKNWKKKKKKEKKRKMKANPLTQEMVSQMPIIFFWIWFSQRRIQRIDWALHLKGVWSCTAMKRLCQKESEGEKGDIAIFWRKSLPQRRQNQNQSHSHILLQTFECRTAPGLKGCPKDAVKRRDFHFLNSCRTVKSFFGDRV